MKHMGRNERGLLSLEACIVVIIFMFLMLFLYSFFVVFEVRNEIGHVLLATANSMAFDEFENDKLGNSGNFGQLIYNLYGENTNDNTDFTDYQRWYETTTETDDSGAEVISSGFSGAIQDRFIAYLTGGGTNSAETILQRYHIVGGLDGLDFSGSSVSGGRLFLSVRYKIEYEFNVFGLGEAEFEHKACSKMWS